MELTSILKDIQNSKFIKEINKKGNSYFIGGIIRDLLINEYENKKLKSKDIDITVSGLSEKDLTDILKKYGKVDMVGESFAVFKFKPHDFKIDDYIDISLCRKERKTSKGHKGFTVDVDKSFTIYDDLERRDFTINSIAYCLSSGELIDPHEGCLDLKKKLIKATNKSAFALDPLRIIRALQFSARFNFEIEEETKKMMLTFRQYLRQDNEEAIAGERIYDEIRKVWDKKGNLNKFINDFAIFGEEIFDGEIYPAYHITKCENRTFNIFEDFISTLLTFSGGSTEQYKTILKADNNSFDRLQIIDNDFAILELFDGYSEQIDEMLIKVHKKDKEVLKSSFLPKEVKFRLEHIQKNNLALSLKEYNKKHGVNGKTLMEKGFKGKDIGDELHRLLLEEIKSLDIAYFGTMRGNPDAKLEYIAPKKL